MFTSASNAVKAVKSGDTIYVHSAAATPTILTQALTDRASELKDVEFCHLHTGGIAPYADPMYKDNFSINSLFVGANVRHTFKQGNGSYTPMFLSEMGIAIQNKKIKVDVVFIQVSPPDQHGFCSLGTSVENIPAALSVARLVIAQVNKYMPRTFGDSIIHISKINYLVEHHQELYTLENGEISDQELRIGQFIAELIPDKSCLQMGIGSIPNAVLSKLTNHKGLGLHTEMFSDGIIPLVESGVITGEHKEHLKGKIVSTFAHGTKKLYDFLDNNPSVEMREAPFTNDPFVIKQLSNMVAINSAIEVDITGQVSADSIGPNIFSGVGGQIDFIYGTSRSINGKSIVALPAATAKGHNKIVPFLKQGAGVVTTRAHVDYIVTEFGVAQLYGKTIKQRIKEMVKIAHPDFQESIEKTYYDSLK